MYQVGIVTLSDKGAKGERQDLSGPKIQELLPKDKYEVISYTMLPDDREKIRRELIRLSDEVKCDLILTTGGTGFSPRDITPEATMDLAEAAHREKKKSVLEQLKSQPAQERPHKTALKKSAEKEL